MNSSRFSSRLKIYYIVSERKLGFFVQIKEDENFNRPSTICQSYGAGRNTLSISRIYPPSNLG